MEPLGQHKAREAVQVLGLLWHWHRQPVRSLRELQAWLRVKAPGSWRVSQRILFSAAPANHETKLLQV